LDLVTAGIPAACARARKLFRRLFLTRLVELFDAGLLRFFGKQAGLCDRAIFQRHLAPVRKKSWIVYAKPPFAGPAAVLAYLSRSPTGSRSPTDG